MHDLDGTWNLAASLQRLQASKCMHKLTGGSNSRDLTVAIDEHTSPHNGELGPKRHTLLETPQIPWARARAWGQGISNRRR